MRCPQVCAGLVRRILEISTTSSGGTVKIAALIHDQAGQGSIAVVTVAKAPEDALARGECLTATGQAKEG
jgi:hypothetical protein